MGKGLLIVAIFTLSLFFTSLIVGYFATEAYGDTSVSTFTLPNSLESYYGAQDYQSGNFNSSITEIRGLFTNWEFQQNVGMVHTVNGLLDTNYFLINNIQPDSNKHVKNYYVINNSVKEDFLIVLLYTNRGVGRTEIIVKRDGLHIPEYSLFNYIIGDRQYIPLPNANQYEQVEIYTDFFIGDKDNLPSGTITFNGEAFNLVNIEPDALKAYTNKYGGISSSTIGTTLVYFNSENRIGDVTDNPYLTGIDRTASFISFVFTLLIWSLPEHIMPAYLQMILIAPQEFMILVGAVMFIKEG